MLISRTRHAEIIPIYHGLTISGRPSLSGGVLSILCECCCASLLPSPCVSSDFMIFCLADFFIYASMRLSFLRPPPVCRVFYAPVPFALPRFLCLFCVPAPFSCVTNRIFLPPLCAQVLILPCRCWRWGRQERDNMLALACWLIVLLCGEGE